MIGAQFLEDHDADGEGTSVKNGEDGVVADLGDTREEDGEDSDCDGGDDGSEEGAEDAKGENPGGDGDSREKAVAEGGELERAAVQEDEGTGVSVHKADDEGGEEGSLIEGDLKELIHERGGGRSEEFGGRARSP